MGLSPGVMTELLNLMNHVAEQGPGTNGRQWQHPSDLTRRYRHLHVCLSTAALCRGHFSLNWRMDCIFSNAVTYSFLSIDFTLKLFFFFYVFVFIFSQFFSSEITKDDLEMTEQITLWTNGRTRTTGTTSALPISHRSLREVQFCKPKQQSIFQRNI